MKYFSEDHLSDEAYLCAELIIEEKIKTLVLLSRELSRQLKKNLFLAI